MDSSICFVVRRNLGSPTSSLFWNIFIDSITCSTEHERINLKEYVCIALKTNMHLQFDK